MRAKALSRLAFSRVLVVASIAGALALTTLSLAQQPKGQPPKPKPTAQPAPKAPPAGAAKKPAARPDAGAAPMVPDSERDAGAPLAARPEAPSALAGGSPTDAGVEIRMADGGARVFRFGEMEIEGRLKSPQLVYFLRRVRAEFAAGDLGHRSFSRELSDTRSDPSF